MPQGDQDAEGQNDANPIKLEDVLVTDFERLSKVLYPRDIPVYQKAPELSDDEWESILKLATLWDFRDVRQLAIDALNSRKTSAYQRILLGRKYRISEWLRSGYVDLVKQPETLSVEDAEKIGYLTAVRILILRETHRKNYKGLPAGLTTRYSNHTPVCSKCSSSAYSSVIICSSCTKHIGIGNNGSGELPTHEIQSAVGIEFGVEFNEIGDRPWTPVTEPPSEMGSVEVEDKERF
ncbi:hypothetical protein VKT23_007963 [Stygiomarasmius scandens]|uniref:Uncharacterized protein n=1 Tax=Marasmiellus scandens TaxID=2682957 RepID=A0ABR1JJQ3_9AGAR